jgi:hypothetical protein
MTTVPLDPPTERAIDEKILAYTKARFDEYDRAQAALANLRAAYRTFGDALAEAGKAMDAAKIYNPEEWFELARRITPADLSVPGRVVPYITHDPEHFFEADVLVAALHREMFDLAERVEGDVQTIARQLRDTDEEATP